MRARLTSRFSLLFMMTFALMLALPAVAFADDAIVDGDGLAPLAGNDMHFGTVCSGVESSKSAPVFINRSGQVVSFPSGPYVPPDVFVGSYEQPSVYIGGIWPNDTGLSAQLGTDGTITLPADWVQKPDNTQSASVPSTVKLNSSDLGPGSAVIYYTAQGYNSRDQVISDTYTMNVSWTTVSCDTTAPTVSSITRANANPTNASSVSWTVTFSENVTGVNAADFNAVSGGGLGGSPAVTNVQQGANASVYTVTASSGSGSGTLGLNLNDDDSIKDAANNPLGGSGNGNSTGQTYTIDRTAPTVTPTAVKGSAANNFVGAASYTAGDWTNQDVRVTFTCADTGGSGLTSGSGNQNHDFTTETNAIGLMATFTGTCADEAGNTASASNFGPVKIDKTAPTISDQGPTTAPNQNNWFNADVTNRFEASDSLSGLSSACNTAFPASSGGGAGMGGAIFNNQGELIVSNQAGENVQSKTTSGEGAALNVTSDSCSDAAGNTAQGLKSANFNVDKTDPVITDLGAKQADNTTANAPTGIDNSGAHPVEWYNHDVNNVFRASDATSGFGGTTTSPYLIPKSITAEGRGLKVASGAVTDLAGNTAVSIDTAPFNIDRKGPSAPTTSFSKSPEDAVGNWYKDTVTVSYNGSADPSLADSSAGSGVKGYTADQTFSTTGTHNYSGTATDYAANASNATAGSLKVDADAPTVGITGCPTSPVVLNSTQSITVAAGDVGSGLVSNPSGSVSLDTGSVGSKTKTITVADKVGHSNSATCSYSVKYGFTGFLSPIPQSSYIAGSTIPVKFGLTNAAGARISDAAAQALVASPCKVKVSFNSGTKNCAAYNATTDTFQFDVKTPKSLASGRYNIVVEVSAPDGSGVVNSETVRVNIRR